MTSYLTPLLEKETANARQSVIQAALFMAIAFLILLVHVELGSHLGVLGLAWFVGITLAALATKKELAFTLLLTSLFLQNAFISFVSPGIPGADDYKMLGATSFISVCLTGLVCLPAWFKFRDQMPPQNRLLLKWLVLFLIMTAVYTAVGIALLPFPSVAVYVRLYLGGCLMLAIGIVFGWHLPMRYVVNTIHLLAVILIVWGFIEFNYTFGLYDVLHVTDFMHLKFLNSADNIIFATVSDAVNYSSQSYLNLSGMMGLDLQFVRMMGPNLHPITFAYCLIFCALICFCYRSHVLMLASIVLAVLVGAKGPLIILFISLALYGYYRWVRRPRLLLLAILILMVAYISIGIVYGLATDDFHVVGLLGGVKGFFHNPFGHGIGAGGTLSSSGDTTSLHDLQFYQSYGADYGFESSVGVGLYQVGIGMIIFVMFYKRLWQAVWKVVLAQPAEPRLVMVPIVLLLLVVNGFFQEEALSPAGWGIWLLFSGLLIGKAWTPVFKEVVSAPQPVRSHVSPL